MNFTQTRSPQFLHAIGLVLDWEGGGKLTDDKADAGGLTRWGISKRWHPEVDVENLTREGAIDLYHAFYWEPIRADELPAPLALILFDSCVNPGQGWAVPALQRILRLSADGVVGPDTIESAARSDWRAVMALTSARLEEFDRRVRVRPVNIRFGAGWRNRCLLAYRASLMVMVPVDVAIASI